MPVVYADVLVALNWLADYLLLAAVAVVLRLPAKRWRLVLAGLLGGVCACLIFLPPLPGLWWLLTNVAVAGGMVAIAFSFHSVLAFLKRTAVLFILSALFSGVVAALSRFTAGEAVVVSNGQVYADLSPLLLAALATVSYGAIRLYERLTRKHLPQGGEYRLYIEDESTVYEGKALHDTGLHLREPFSGAPVILVEREGAGALFSTLPPHRLRRIPYRSVGGNGLLTAFRPRCIRLRKIGGRERDVSGAYVALTEELGRGEYEALIGSELTQ